MNTDPELERRLAELSAKGILAVRTENNPHLKVSYKGAGGLVSPKWNVKVYRSGSVVCNDEGLLGQMRAGTLAAADAGLALLQCDDAGWGFPLGGVMVGVTDGARVECAVVGVEWFRKPEFAEKSYLLRYADEGMALVANFGASPATHRVEICTGHVNSGLREALRGAGYDVRVCEVKGLLQDELEARYRAHIRDLCGLDLAYDPKQCGAAELAERYGAAVAWARANRPGLLKDGWGSFSKGTR